MSGNMLSPQFAAELASNVYLIKDDFGRRGFKAKYKDDLDASDNAMVSGTTGGLVFLHKPHVMAIFSTGKGRFKGHAFVAFKGTASLYDALTDLNTGIRRSHAGCAVHQGFHQAFDSVLLELQQFTNNLKGVTAVHCIGHSLGGAIATLAADWLRTSSAGPQVKLYTFGSPRVGLEMFASQCTTRIKSANVYRVYHETDPVPMLPTWPFYHVPTRDADYLVWSPITGKPWEYHLMKHYIASAKHAGNWEVIKKNRPKEIMDDAVERWLKSDGAVSLTANTLELLSASLFYVLKKVVNAAGILMVGGFATTFTLLDRMAVFMANAAKVSVELSSWVFYLVKKMAALTGVVVKTGAELTASFIRAAFLRLHQRIADLIWHAGKEVG